MKYLFITVAVITLLFAGAALPQTLTEAEYFFDSDPGLGNGTPLTITEADCVSVSDIILPPGPGTGFHRFSMRYRDNTGVWGEPDARIFFLFAFDTLNYEARTLTDAEYFFDTDPGLGNGTPLAITESDCVMVSGFAPLDGLETGFHRFYMRYRDDTGVWGEPDARIFFLIETGGSNYEVRTLTAAEYFFDTDPGEGNGAPLSVTESDCVFVSDIVSLEELEIGLHRFFVRYQDDTGVWSQPDGRMFFITLPPQPPQEQPFLSGAEYFINYDPGPGAGIALLPEDGAWDELEETLVDTIAEIPAGKHWLGVRFQDNSGIWSMTMADSFAVEPILTIRISGTDAILDWQADASSTIYVYRATEADGAYSFVDSTSADSYTDIDITSASSTQFYHITQSTSRASAFRLPKYPIADNQQDMR